MTGQPHGSHEPIDYPSLADALLARSRILVPQWLPGGVERNDRWYVGDFDGGEGESANVNLTTGTWIDNGGDYSDRGGDLISLYARIRGLNNAQAARELMRDLGWTRERPAATPSSTAAASASHQEPPPDEAPPHGAPAAAGGQGHAPRRSAWRAIVPVPPHAPPPRFEWAYRDKGEGRWIKLQAVRHWEYAFNGQRLGYVARFERTNSHGELVKDTLPLTWCEDTTDPAGSQRWHWKQWEAPRPLYVPATLLAEDPRLVPVVVVEGEKCAQAGHELLGHEFDFVAWPGGCKAWAQADWTWLSGRTVYLWPDADAQRERLTKAERESGADPQSKPVRPALKQPGMSAMVGIGTLLQAGLGCAVCLVQIGEPGDRPDGWDLADAVEQGWDAARVRDFIRAAAPFVAPDDAARAKVAADASAGASQDSEPTSWRGALLASQSGATKAVRENVVLALDGLPEQGIAGIAELADLVAFNEFTNDVVKTRDAPWGTRAGVWEETDELELGNWLTRTHWLPPMPRGTLEEAVSMVARRHRFHPVRDWLATLRSRWDGQRRCATWLRRCCLEEDEFDDADPLQQYLARVGTWLLMAICARVLHPGCKFDYMVIFEGAQGVGKSTLARVLGGDHFADTGLVLGDKDSYQNLQGVLVYEWGELDSLNRSEVTKVKQFVSSLKDRFRATYDRRPKDYPRQVVFIGTTNEDHYLVDITGNRRFWPVRVQRQIDLDWLRENREQLFAEALSYVDAGERFYPTPKEQKLLFEPQQSQRQIENAIAAGVIRYLHDDKQHVSMHGEKGTFVDEITVSDLLSRLGISVDKQTHVLQRQATAALRQVGWERFRSSRGDRPWMFRRPEQPKLPEADKRKAGASRLSSTQHDAAADPVGADSGCPF